MKYLLVLAVLVVAFMIWRANRRNDNDKPRSERGKAAGRTIDMIGCDVCGVLCPKTDLVRGRRGAYCCTQHRDQAEA